MNRNQRVFFINACCATVWGQNAGTEGELAAHRRDPSHTPLHRRRRRIGPLWSALVAQRAAGGCTAPADRRARRWNPAATGSIKAVGGTGARRCCCCCPPTADSAAAAAVAVVCWHPMGVEPVGRLSAGAAAGRCWCHCFNCCSDARAIPLIDPRPRSKGRTYLTITLNQRCRATFLAVFVHVGPVGLPSLRLLSPWVSRQCVAQPCPCYPSKL